ncbi:MAG: NDP-sugar synthase [Elusimicrobia bacterium]|nr:NDP-sugar synthase [Elusimicrobiota bacterium]
MKALLLSGGKGTRLRPFTLTTPKPLLPIANIPLITWQFEFLRHYGITEIIVGVGYKPESFKKTVEKIAGKMKIKTHLSIENTPLGTGGGFRNAYPFFKEETEPFVVLNGDVIGDFNLNQIIAFHREKGADITIGLTKINNPSSYGLIITDSNMGVKKFIEKPKTEEIVCDTINAGLYIFTPEIFSEIPAGKNISIEKEVFPALLKNGKKIYGVIHNGYWVDVGTVAKYKQTNFDALEGKTGIYSIRGQGDNFLAGDNSVLKEDVQIKGRVIIGNNCVVGNGCVLEESIIMNNTIIRDRVVIKNSVVGTDVAIENDSVIDNMILADKSLVRPFTQPMRD